jgi:two-component system, LuxR family, sensor kinase FixL
MSVRAHDIAGPQEAVARDAQSLQSGLRLALGWCAFVGAYFLAYRYGMSFGQSTASPFWFPDPILLCALLLTRPRYWWIFVPSTLPIRLLTAVPPDVPLWFLIATFVIDSARGLLTAALLRRFLVNPTRLDTVREFAVFFAFAVVLVPALTALGGAAARSVLGYDFWPTWQQWFMGNALAHVVITPAILYWVVGLPRKLHVPAPMRMVEGVALTLGLLVTSYLAFESQSKGVGIAEPAFYAPVPFLFWAAIRFGMFGASGAIVVIAIMAVHAAIVGHGPFTGGSPAETALYLQNFMLWRAAPLYLVAILIAQKNGIELSLRESEARFRNMADYAPALIWVSGQDQECTYFNQRWLDFTARTHAQEAGHGWLEGVHPEDRERCTSSRSAAFAARLPVTTEYQLRRSDGQYRSFLEHAVPRFTANGAFLGFIGSCIDITDRKRAAAELNRQRTELTHASRVSTMGQLAAALAHEINQPLAAILRNAEAAELILQQQPLDQGELRAILEDIRSDDQRAGAVIDRMRSLLKRRDFELESLELTPLFEQVAALVRTDLLSRQVMLELHLPDGLPRVRGDRVHLQQVLLNLLVNGADAMNTSSPDRRRLEVGARVVDDQSVEVTVVDAGPGIAEARLEQVFEPFFTTKSAGMGLGLAICRTIIEAHGGRIWARNENHNGGRGGAAFHFTLKRAAEEAAP